MLINKSVSFITFCCVKIIKLTIFELCNANKLNHNGHKIDSKKMYREMEEINFIKLALQIKGVVNVVFELNKK